MTPERKRRYLVNTAKNMRAYIHGHLVGMSIADGPILWVAGCTRSEIIEQNIKHKRQAWRKRGRK